MNRWMEVALRLHVENPVVDSLAPNWDSEMYLSPQMVELARNLRQRGLSRGQIQEQLATYLVQNIGLDPQLRDGYIQWWRRAAVTAASTSLIFSGPPSLGWDRVLRSIGRAHRLLALLRERFRLALGPEDITDAHAAGYHCIILNLQDAAPIGDDFARIGTLYGLGVRIVQLTYNLRNLYGDGCLERRDGGLSRFGVALVERLNEAGIVIDTSHCSDQTVLDTLEVSCRPVAITHTASRELGGHPRGKPDHVVRAVAEAGGYIGAAICPFMLVPGGRGATLDHVVDHVQHLINVAGTDCVGIGTDWAKPYYRVLDWPRNSVAEFVRPGEFDWVGWLPEHHFSPSEPCEGMETWDLWPRLTAKMLERGLSEQVVVKVIGRNFLRFWRDAVGPGGSPRSREPRGATGDLGKEHGSGGGLLGGA